MRRKLYMLIVVLLLSACNNNKPLIDPEVNVKEPNDDYSPATKVKDEVKQERQLNLNKNKLNEIDILSLEFKKDFTDSRQQGYLNLVEYELFKDVKKELGNYKVKDLGIRDFGVVFNDVPNIELVFDRNFGVIPDAQANLRRIYFTNYSGKGTIEEVMKVWGKPEYIGEWHDDIQMYYFELKYGNYAEFMFQDDKLVSMNKVRSNVFSDALSASFAMTDSNLPMDLMHENVMQGILKNQLNIKGVKVLDDASKLIGMKKVYGAYSIVDDGEKITKIAIDMSSDIHTDIYELREQWGDKYEVERIGNVDVTTYDYDIDDGYVTQIKSYDNGRITEIANVSDDYKAPESETMDTSDENIIEKNGVAHYKLPDIMTKSFRDKVNNNQITLFGKKVGDEEGKLIKQLGPPIEEQGSKYSANSYIYDNFEIDILDGKVLKISFDVEDKAINPEILMKAWGIKDFEKSESQIKIDPHLEDGYFTEIFVYEGKVNRINIYGDIDEWYNKSE